MKRSVDFRLSVPQRRRDHKRAEVALGKSLGSHPVHHHSPTQLVICEDVAYHALLHQRQHDYRMEHDEAFAESEAARYEAITAGIERRTEILKRLVLRVTGWTPEMLEGEMAELALLLPPERRP